MAKSGHSLAALEVLLHVELVADGAHHLVHVLAEGTPHARGREGRPPRGEDGRPERGSDLVGAIARERGQLEGGEQSRQPSVLLRLARRGPGLGERRLLRLRDAFGRRCAKSRALFSLERVADRVRNRERLRRSCRRIGYGKRMRLEAGGRVTEDLPKLLARDRRARHAESRTEVFS